MTRFRISAVFPQQHRTISPSTTNWKYSSVMELLWKLFMLATILFLLCDSSPVSKGIITYTTKSGVPSNVHYINSKPEMRKGKKSVRDNFRDKGQEAEIIKVPLRTHNNGCPKNQKKDAKGRCRPSWN